MSRRGLLSGALALALLAAVFASVRQLSACGDGLPQRAGDGGVLAVALGDARSVISRAAYHRADSYFHGGVDMDGGETAAASGCDPIGWINSRIRAPEVHCHLEGKRSLELMPWFWAAVKTDPHNVEAWEAAWYCAASIVKDRDLAARVLVEAKRHNPDSAELWLTEGQFLYERGKGDVAAAKRCFERAVELSAPDSQVREFARRYLADIAKAKGNPLPSGN